MYGTVPVSVMSRAALRQPMFIRQVPIWLEERSKDQIHAQGDGSRECDVCQIFHDCLTPKWLRTFRIRPVHFSLRLRVDPALIDPA